ncbi:MAG: peroxide stress protein YaaA, partial [Verrucomicrobiota bacterium]
TPSHRPTQPQFLDRAEELVGVLRKKTRPQLRELMSISEGLADLNFQRYREFSVPFTQDNARAALLAFKGDVYTDFSLADYGREDFQFAQKHLRILSGLYGVLRPLDLIQPYRLEMGTDLKTALGRNLYTFWGDNLSKSLNRSFKASGSVVLINLASKEYFSAIDQSALKGEIITPSFKDLRKGTYRVLSFFAKKARGAMCDFMIREQIEDPEGLKAFSGGGYRFNAKLSEGNQWIFTRDSPPAA